MMLHSNQEWELEELDTSEWIPRLDGKVVSPEDSMIPTPEMVKLLVRITPGTLNLDSAGLDSDEFEPVPRRLGFWSTTRWGRSF